MAKRRPPVSGGSCDYIEEAIGGSRKGAVHQFRDSAGGYQLLTVKINTLRKFTQASDFRSFFFWKDVSYGK
jgi:hypothetical protein